MKPGWKRTAACLLVCLASLLGAPPSRLEATAKPDFVIAYTDKMLTDIDSKDMASAMTMYVDEIAKQAGYRGAPYRYENLDDAVTKTREGVVDFLSLTSLDYLRIKKKLDIELSLGQVKGGKGGVRYLLLVNENRGYKALGDLRDKKLLVPKGDEIAALYLNTMLLKDRLGEAKRFFAVVEEKNKPSQAILPVFFGQADACVTTDVSFKTTVELNPQLGRAIKILASSPELVTAVTAFRRSVNPDIQQKTREIGLKLKDNARGRQILMLFKLDDLRQIEETDLTSIRELVSDYDRLKAGKR